MDPFKFNPEDIFENENVFVKKPKNEKETRSQLSKPLIQLRTWINEVLIPNILTSAEIKKLINNATFEAGSADMNKSVYDNDNDGVVEKADYSESTKTVDSISDSDLPIEARAVLKYKESIESTHRKKINTDSIDIDDAPGNWAVDISETGHGTVPDVFIHVEQSEGDNFRIQRATKCNNSSDGSRYAGVQYVRDQYIGQAWSQWTMIPVIVFGTSETAPSNLPEGAYYAWVEE